MKSKKKPNLQEAETSGLLLTGQEKGLPTDEAGLYELTEYTRLVVGGKESMYLWHR
jgi:hypothetical protein